MHSSKACSAFDRLSSYQWSRIDRERSMRKGFQQCRGLMVHSYFLGMLTLVVVLRANEHKFHVKTALLSMYATDQFKYVANNVTSWKTFGDISGRQMLYVYMKNLLIPTFYRDDRKDSPLFATVRQVRVEPATSIFFPKSVIPNLPSYSFPPWSPSAESRSPFGPANAMHWTYTSFFEDSDVYGTFHTYPAAGGFILVLPPSEAIALDILAEMEENDWVDEATRAIITNIYVYNHHVNLLCNIELLVELTSDGVMYPSQTGYCAPVIEVDLKSDYVRLATDIVVYLMLLILITKEAFYLITLQFNRMLYLSLLARLLMIAFTITALILFIFSYNSTTKFLYLWDSVSDEDTDKILELISYIHFSAVSEERACIYLAAAIFCAWLVLFRYVVFVESSEVVRVIKTSKMDLIQFILFYLVLMCGFALCAYIVFSGNISQFRTFDQSVMTLFNIIQGDFDTFELRTEYTYTGLLFFILVAFLLYFVCTNMFFVILNYHYDNVISTDVDVLNSQYEHFFTHVKRNILGKIGIWKMPSGVAVNRKDLRRLGFSRNTIQAYEAITLGKMETALMRNLNDGVLQSDLEKVSKKIYEIERKMGQVFDHINGVLEFADSKYACGEQIVVVQVAIFYDPVSENLSPSFSIYFG